MILGKNGYARNICSAFTVYTLIGLGMFVSCNGTPNVIMYPFSRLLAATSVIILCRCWSPVNTGPRVPTNRRGRATRY